MPGHVGRVIVHLHPIHCPGRHLRSARLTPSILGPRYIPGLLSSLPPSPTPHHPVPVVSCNIVIPFLCHSFSNGEHSAKL